MAENRTSDSVISSDEVGNNETSKRKSVTTEFDSTFGTKTWREDTTIIVEGKRLHVSSSVLSLLSPVFTRMFEEKLDSNGPMEIELEGKTHADFLEFLKCFYPNIIKKVTLDNVFVVLPLAVEFGAERLVQTCEDVLIETTKMTTNAEVIFKYLSKAFEYKLTRLQKTCTEEACKQSYKDIKEAVKKYPIPVETKVKIQTELLEAHEKVLKSVNLMELLFEDKTSLGMKNPRVGYLEYYFKMPQYSIRNSRQVTVHAINWQISLDTVSDKEKLGLYLNAVPMRDHCDDDWQCRAYSDLCLYNFKNVCLSVRKKSKINTYSSKSPGWGFAPFAEMKSVTDTDAGFLKDGSIKIEITFLLKNLPLTKFVETRHIYRECKIFRE